MSRQLARILELAFLFTAILIPQFILAYKMEGDTLAKSTIGIGIATAIITAYEAWKSNRQRGNRKRNKQDNQSSS